jgi:SMC interacting uncharacterized protein involved in chromosome segregation
MALEIRQVRQQLTQVGLVIHRATQALRNDKGAPQELIDHVERLDQQSQDAQETVKDVQDETALFRFVYDMEQTSDRAQQACENASDLSAQAKSAVQLAHRQVSNLKYQLH